MNIAKAERGCLRAPPRAETYQLCADCVHALGEPPPPAVEPRGPGRPQPTPTERERILAALFADGCPHGCDGPCGFTVRVTRMLAAVAKEPEAVHERA